MNEKIQKFPFEYYDDAVNWIHSLTALQMKPGLKRMEQLMEKLHHPERRLKFIHVAGTNGKGSTCAFISQVLLESGYNVGRFTSPYIETFTDRIQYNGEGIAKDDLVAVCNILYPLVNEIAATDLGSPTMFEVVTALSIYYYAAVRVADFVVFEVGLGGRLDSTNVVQPIVAVITNIGLDHTEILGKTGAEIAREKAGIIKSGVPLICGVEQKEALQAVREIAKQKKAAMYTLNEQFSFEPISVRLDSQMFVFRDLFRTVPDIEISLNGEHQMKNAAVAVMTLEVLRQYYAVIVDDENLYAGLRETIWPGRLEMIISDPHILLDGAHNAEGAEALVQALKSRYRFEKLHFMVGMIHSKNHPGYFRHILPIVDSLIITEPDFHKKMSATELAQTLQEILREADRPIEWSVEPDWKKALEQLMQKTKKDDLGVATGTLYLISDVRSWLLYQSDSEKGW